MDKKVSDIIIDPPNTKEILSSIGKLSKSPNFQDVRIVCNDGCVKWNRFLISANSKFLNDCFKELGDCEEGLNSSVIIIPDISSSLLSNLLNLTLDYEVKRDGLNDLEQQIMDLLGFILPQRNYNLSPCSSMDLPIHSNSCSESFTPSQLDCDLEIDSCNLFDNESSNQEIEFSNKSSPEENSPTNAQDIFKSEDSMLNNIFTSQDVDSMISMNDSDDFNVFQSTEQLVDDNKEENFSIEEFETKDEPESPAIQSRFSCSECGKGFTRSQHLEQHMANHTRDKSFICDICGKIFHHESLLRSHLRYHEDIAKDYPCDECEEVFKGKRALNFHIQEVHDVILCLQCDVNIPKSKLKKHQEQIHGIKFTKKKNRKYFCHVCTKGFDSMRGLMIHKRTHENGSGLIQEKNDNTCVLCKKRFACQSHLEIHMQKNHSEIECDVCGKMVRNIIRHQINVHSPGNYNPKMNRTKCPQDNCDKWFSTAYAAKYHYSIAHTKTKLAKAKQKCLICDKEFLNLSRHVKEVHSENRYECQLCGHFFPVKQSLERHIKNVHNRIQNTCPFCKKRFVHLAGHLERHLKCEKSIIKEIAEGLSGRMAARTDLQWTAFSHKMPEENSST